MARRRAAVLDDTGWVQVRSTNVRRVRHLGAPVNTLLVRFADGSVYAYYNRGRSVYHRMIASASKGRFVARVLTPGGDYEKVAADYEYP